MLDLQLTLPLRFSFLRVPFTTPNLQRRGFLIRCCQGASLFFSPAGLHGEAFPNDFPDEMRSALGHPSELRLTPHYRSATPLDPVLLKLQPGSDDFISERYATRMEKLLSKWRDRLLQSPSDLQAVEHVLATNFHATPITPSREQTARANADLEIFRRQFPSTGTIGPKEFVRQLRNDLKPFEKLLTVEFQITGIELAPPTGTQQTTPTSVRTRIRYELTGSGTGFHREQRVGEWELAWIAGNTENLRIRSWRMLGETRSRSLHRLFEDITTRALKGNKCYASQFLRGADYWRTVLDAATGIDIYGNNGLAVGDFDSDGYDDVYVCQPAGLPNRLLRNRRDGTFEDVTGVSGLGLLENTSCALFLDVTNNGLQDLIVVRTDGPELYLNQGGGRFVHKPGTFHFARPPLGSFTGAAAADYDRDGRLDIYFCLYLYYQGVNQYRYPVPFFDAENGPANILMHNEGDGTFRDVTAETGLEKNNHRYSFCCGWGDFNGDGWPDLYVINDFGRNNLYRNRGDGTFTDVSAKAGVEDTGAGMSVSWFDYDNDGHQDLYVGNMWTAAGLRVTAQDNFMKRAPADVRSFNRQLTMGNTLFHNSGDGTFGDTSSSAGVEVGRWAWSSDAWDFDFDGYPDIYIANGMVSGPRTPDLASFFWRQVAAQSPWHEEHSRAYEEGWNAINELLRSDFAWNGFERNVFYANNRDGTFAEISGAVEMDFVEDGRTYALADFDHDGRQEVFVKNRNGPQVRILKNRMRELGAAIAFQLRGHKSNRDAIGASVTVTAGGRQLTQYLCAGSGFLAQHSKQMFFGLGNAKGPVEATIRWPGGSVQNFHNLPVGHLISVEEGVPVFHAEAFRPTSGDGIPQPPQSVTLPTRVETWLLAPVAAPEFSLPDLNGKIHTLDKYRGHPLLLNFWSTESPACGKELESFEFHHKQWALSGLALAALNVNLPGNAAEVEAYARSHKLSFNILVASQDAAAIYNLLFRYLYDRHRNLPIPTSFLLDSQGIIVKVYQGLANPRRIAEDFLKIPRTPRARLAKALPFPGVTEATKFQRNYLSLGSVYYRRGYFEPAAAAFQRALANNPSSAEAYYGLGSAYLKQEKVNEAHGCFQHAIRLNANYSNTLPNSWNNLGIIAARRGSMEEAIKDFQEALRYNPRYLIALQNLGNAYRQLGRWQEARQALEQALKVNPKDAEANYSLGMVFAEIGDAVNAHKHLEKALEARPDYPQALNNLGVLYLRTGQRYKAVKSFEACMRVAPSFDQSYLNLSRLYALEGQNSKARAVLLELLKQLPKDDRARQALEELNQ